MATFIWTNNASSTLAAPISSTAVSVAVAVGTGAEFPNPGAGQQFTLTFNDAATGLLTEIAYCTARASDVMTIVRAQEGTVAQNWSAGDLCANLITAGAMASFFQNATYQGQSSSVYLEYVSASEISLVPRGGNTLVIDGSIYAVPAGGIVSGLTGVYVAGVAAQNLAASTVYDVFVFNNAGTLTFDFWATGGHIPDTTAGNVGVEVRNNSGTPDSTRSYVGRIATTVTPNFGTGQAYNVASWFNRRPVNVSSPLLLVETTTNTVMAELSASGRTSVLVFADNGVVFTMLAEIASSVSGASGSVTIGVGGVFTATGSVSTSATGGQNNSVTSSYLYENGNDSYPTLSPGGQSSSGASTATFSNLSINGVVWC